MKRKIIIDGGRPSDSEIETLKDWPEVKRSSSTRANWFIRGIAAAVIGGIVSLFWWVGLDKPSDSSGAGAGVSQDTLIAQTPTFPLFDLPADVFEIDASTATSLITSNGTIVSIEANSFDLTDPSNSTVLIKFTDLSDPWAIYASGIPMDYDSVGVRHFFQSAGMFDIQAEQDGNPLSLAKESTIRVAYPTYNDQDKMNSYLLNSDNNWAYIEPSKTESVEKVCADLGLVYSRPMANKVKSQLPNTSRSSGKNLPPPPRKANPDNYRFNLDIDPLEFPELSAMTNIQFEVVDPRFKYSFYNETWENIELKPLDDGQYLIILKKKKKEERFKVYPVLDGAEFELAFAQYQTELNKTKQDKAQASERVDYEEWTAEQKTRNPTIAPKNKDREFYSKLTANLEEGKKYRTINMPSLGVCNFDNPIKIPVGEGLDAAFYYTENGHTIQFPEVCLIELNSALFLQYTGSELREFRFRPKMTNCAIAYGPDGRIAIGLPSLFDEVPKDAKYWHFKLELSETSFESYEELKAFVEEKMEGPQTL